MSKSLRDFIQEEQEERIVDLIETEEPQDYDYEQHRPRSYKMLSQDKGEELRVVEDYILGTSTADIYIKYNITKDALYKAIYNAGLSDKNTIRSILSLYGKVDNKRIHEYLELDKDTVYLVLNTLDEGGLLDA